ncbi:MAG TPA: hypothetical protein V6C81_09250 [Planktothrix sp.]|jgi:hypothetical protein
MKSQDTQFKLNDDQRLCFWVGFLGTGLFMAAFIWVESTLIEALCRTREMTICNIVPAFLYFGLPSGLLGLWFGSAAKNIKPQMPHRWILLTVVVSLLNFQLAGLQLQLLDAIDTKHLCGTVDDAMFFSLVFIGAGLSSSIVAIAVIALLKGFARFRNAVIYPQNVV